MRMYYETCKTKGDAAGQCEACAAMSGAYESIGRMDSAIEILHEFIGIAERARLEEAYSRACCLLGNVLNQLVRTDLQLQTNLIVLTSVLPSRARKVI
jgi:hypothetical protein